MALFEPGQSGNPDGRPAGSRNKLTLAVEKLFEDDAETIAKKAIEMAKSGDTALIRLCLGRLFANYAKALEVIELDERVSRLEEVCGSP